MSVNDTDGRVFRVGLGIAVMAAWLVCIAAEVASSGAFSTPLPVHALMGTVVGSVFGDAALRRARRSASNGTEEES